jgi:hypothetical protein
MFASRADFDFVTITDVRGNLIVFEAVRPARKSRIARLTFGVFCLEYEPIVDMLAVVSASGKALAVVRPFAAFEDVG